MKTAGFQIKIAGYDKHIICQEKEPLLIALARQNVSKVPVGCRNGGCGICKIRVISGEFETGKMSIKHVSPAEKNINITLACKTFPKSDLTITVKI